MNEGFAVVLNYFSDVIVYYALTVTVLEHSVRFC